MIAAIRCGWLFPSNAFLPVTISYRTAPNAKMSVRASASLPSSCSGAMYCMVPRIMPGAVVFTPSPKSLSPGPQQPPADGCFSFASPKSSSLAPLCRQHDVARLQVAMGDALSVRFVQGIRDRDRHLQRLVERQRTSGEPRGQRLALQELHHQEVGALPGGRRRTACRCSDGSARRSSALRARSAGCISGSLGEVRRKHLDRDRAVQPGIGRLVYLAHAARAERREDFVGPESGAGLQ